MTEEHKEAHFTTIEHMATHQIDLRANVTHNPFVYSMDSMNRSSKECGEMICDLEEAKLAIHHNEKKEHLFPVDSDIPNFLLVKLLGDLDRKIQRLSNIYSHQIIPRPPSDQGVGRCSPTADAEHLAHCCAC